MADHPLLCLCKASTFTTEDLLLRRCSLLTWQYVHPFTHNLCFFLFFLIVYHFVGAGNHGLSWSAVTCSCEGNLKVAWDSILLFCCVKLKLLILLLCSNVCYILLFVLFWLPQLSLVGSFSLNIWLLEIQNNIILVLTKTFLEITWWRVSAIRFVGSTSRIHQEIFRDVFFI